MTKKHFITIAADIKRLAATGDRAAVRSFAESLCVTFARLNSNFDRSRFMSACGF